MDVATASWHVLAYPPDVCTRFRVSTREAMGRGQAFPVYHLSITMMHSRDTGHKHVHTLQQRSIYIYTYLTDCLAMKSFDYPLASHSE